MSGKARTRPSWKIHTKDSTPNRPRRNTPMNSLRAAMDGFERAGVITTEQKNEILENKT